MTRPGAFVYQSIIGPFVVDVPAAVLTDLRSRLHATRWPQFITDIDGQRIHFIHARAERPGAVPLLVLHGWPGSVAEMLPIIEPLRDPASTGEDGPAFHVVCVSRPASVSPARPSAPDGTCSASLPRWSSSWPGSGIPASARWAATGEQRRATTSGSNSRRAPRHVPDGGRGGPARRLGRQRARRSRTRVAGRDVGQFQPIPTRIDVPTGCAISPKEVVKSPRSWAARTWDLRHWTEMPKGGHFPAG